MQQPFCRPGRNARPGVHLLQRATPLGYFPCPVRAVSIYGGECRREYIDAWQVQFLPPFVERVYSHPFLVVAFPLVVANARGTTCFVSPWSRVRVPPAAEKRL